MGIIRSITNANQGNISSKSIFNHAELINILHQNNIGKQAVFDALLSGYVTVNTTQILCKLEVYLTPLINSDGTVTMDVNVKLEQFTNAVNPANPSDPSAGNRTIRQVATSALVANNEVLALGGLIRNITSATEAKMPLLGDIPIFGWLFKAKVKQVVTSSILILICPEIIMPERNDLVKDLTQNKIEDNKELFRSMRDRYEQRDPLYRWILNDKQREYKDREMAELDKLASLEGKYLNIDYFAKEGSDIRKNPGNLLINRYINGFEKEVNKINL